VRRNGGARVVNLKFKIPLFWHGAAIGKLTSGLPTTAGSVSGDEVSIQHAACKDLETEIRGTFGSGKAPTESDAIAKLLSTAVAVNNRCMRARSPFLARVPQP
jgi:hypothetical protein